ncbi:aldo/keto reductase [Pseudomonas sp. OTU5201]|uniref:aldo/keto reductase n=1 Tax=Pseudomonas sp. OTU5201 TaxID=3043850 RepID=UPI00313D1615
MNYVRLGSSGLKISPLCLGCMGFGKGRMHGAWSLDEVESWPFFTRALGHGINFFDTADVYGEGASEALLGKFVRQLANRHQVVIATKFSSPMGKGPNDRGASRKRIMSAVDDSLRRLGTDYIDLYQLHRWDYETPFEETAEALNDLVRMGKVLYVGASSMHTWQFAKALAIQERNGWAKFISMQPQYNLVYREEEREMLPFCRDQGIGVIPWSPLARGFLAGNRHVTGGETARARNDAYARTLYFRENDFLIQQRLVKVAAASGITPMRLALAWVSSRPGITAPIIGATRLDQLDEALSALDLDLDSEVIAQLEAPYEPHPVLGHS